MFDVVIIPTTEFCRQAKRLAKKYKSLGADLTALQEMLKKNPFSGVDLGGGKRKIRLAVASKSKGKSGGMRIITFNVEQQENKINIYLVTIFDKSEYANVSEKYLDQIVKALG